MSFLPSNKHFLPLEVSRGPGLFMPPKCLVSDLASFLEVSEVCSRQGGEERDASLVLPVSSINQAPSDWLEGITMRA